jgi:hypothetical protein
VRYGFLVVSPFRIACQLLRWERGGSSKQAWRSHGIIYFFIRTRVDCNGFFDAQSSRSSMHP